jgi:hypothetical protein
VKKIIFEGYLLTNIHIIQLLEDDKETNQSNFFQNVLAQVSVFLHQNEMMCKDKELVTTFEEYYKAL